MSEWTSVSHASAMARLADDASIAINAALQQRPATHAGVQALARIELLLHQICDPTEYSNTDTQDPRVLFDLTAAQALILQALKSNRRRGRLTDEVRELANLATQLRTNSTPAPPRPRYAPLLEMLSLLAGQGALAR